MQRYVSLSEDEYNGIAIFVKDVSCSNITGPIYIKLPHFAPYLSWDGQLVLKVSIILLCVSRKSSCRLYFHLIHG